MRAILRINKKNLDLIKSGIKKTEWRELSEYNKNLLLVYKDDGKRHGNDNIKEVEFINGYKKDSERLVVKVLRIRVVKFTRDIEIKEDNFKALEGQFSIEITLGDIVNN